MIKIPRKLSRDWCGTMNRSKYKYTLHCEGKRVPIYWKEI